MSEAEVEVSETNPINDMIQYALDQDFNKANDVFNDMMTVKLSDVLDQEKIRLSDQIYNGAGEEEEDEDEEQLELDFDDDEISDEPSDEEDFEYEESEDDDEGDLYDEEEEEE